MRKKIHKKTRGDTIVEVLISIALIGLVIAGAYALATRSLRQGITAAERTEALKLAEGQIETLKFRQQKTASAAQWNTTFGAANNFCLDTETSDPSSTDWSPVINTGTNPSTLERKGGVGVVGYDPKCNPDNASNGRFFINITNSNQVYLVAIRWNSISGGQNQSQIYYRF